MTLKPIPVLSSLAGAQTAAAKPAKVVVWDERQPAQKRAYDNFLGNAIADHLRKSSAFDVTSVALDDPDQGLPDRLLNAADVLIWWGHVRHREVKPELASRIVARVKAGLGLIALHSAHWSAPFVAAMDEITRVRVLGALRVSAGETVEVRETAPADRYRAPARDARLTPYVELRKTPDGVTQANIHLPICCFPAYRGDGKPSLVSILLPKHPIARGLPVHFAISETEMYDEDFHVPEPDEVVFEERWADGSWFRSGCVWKLGLGKVVYFRPGHETYPVFKNENVLKLLANSAAWLTSATG